MNIYLFPWHTNDQCTITKIIARNYNECEEKIKQMYLNKYDDLNDLLDYDDFLYDVYDKHGITIGDIFELNEFT